MAGPPIRAPPKFTEEERQELIEELYLEMDNDVMATDNQSVANSAVESATVGELRERIGDVEIGVKKCNRLFDMLQEELKEERNARKALETEIEGLRKMVALLREKW